METMFHCTLKDNLPNILKHGLLPNTPNEIPNAIHGIYLSVHPFEWMHWATDESKYAGALIEIDITGLKLKKNIGIVHNNRKIPEYISKEPIPVGRFINISTSTDKNPCSFEKYDFRSDLNEQGR